MAVRHPCLVTLLGFVILAFSLHFPCLGCLNSLAVLSLCAFQLLLFFFILFEDSYPRAVAEEDQSFSDLELLM